MGHHLFVVTGGPGSGKSTLIAALASRGISTMPEAGRAVIQTQTRLNGAALPWADRTAFADLMFVQDLRTYHQAMDLPAPVMMDRGIPDVVGYLTLCDLPVPERLEQAAKTLRYNRKVFLAPYWDEIFEQDAERKQDRAEAAHTARVMAQTYARLGYDLVPLPLDSVARRVAFVRKHLPN